jgi:hypothetical protein
MEVWKDVPDYEGVYQVSNKGRVKSVDRYIEYSNGRVIFCKGSIRRLQLKKYYECILTKNSNQKHYLVHQLVAMAFLNHVPNGKTLVVDHINNIPTDNRVENLQILSVRENSSKDKRCGKLYTSKYTGVSKRKDNGYYRVKIRIDGIEKYLGQFKNEYDAHLAYQKALTEHLNK